MKLYHFLFVVALAPVCIHGSEIPRDQEPDDVVEPITDDGSGDVEDFGTSPVPEPSINDKMRWVTYSKAHEQMYEASIEDAENVINKYGLRNSKGKSVDCESGKNQKSPAGIIHQLRFRNKDIRSGNAISDSQEDKESREEFTEASVHAENPPPQSEVAKSSSFNPMDTSQYPGFATGMLKSRNCTAFMVGRASALTLAECVYDWNNQHWIKNLDLWRGRNCDTYVSLMIWKTVTIPQLYYEYGDEDYNWAYIQYDDDMPSDNWIGLSFDSKLPHKADVHVTLSGYQEEQLDGGCPYQCRCILLEAKKNKMYCPSNFPFTLLGSPLVAATSIPIESNPNYIGTSPRLYGIASGSIQASINKVTMISEEMFWLVYYLMSYNNDQPTCDANRQEWLIQRIVQDY